MAIKDFKCPNCGRALPESTRANALLTCPACQSTLLISEFSVADAKDAVAVATPTHAYAVSKLLSKDDICTVYKCTFSAEGETWTGMFRIATHAADNDLVEQEARALSHLQSAHNFDKFRPFLPSLLESFLFSDASGDPPRQVNILTMHAHIASPAELYSLEEVRAEYSGGIHPKDMAWMWRRLLNVLGFAHASGVIHGAVLPPYVLIEPRDHKLALTGWGFSVRRPASGAGSPMTAISTSYEGWYPPEILAKQVPSAAADLHLAARTMLYVIGAKMHGGTPEHYLLEPEMAAYFARFLHDDPSRRPQSAWDALDEFDRLIESLWGPRTFRVFTMPGKGS
ncbi:MAG: hypothetical protein KME04_17445 [Pleurocapsa minor GSE-CHR-MK-17-07R]|jgi:serine/threonine protein kinase/DNA-directed RNA polymerase subunit RPC12/RpoP|nr:hypothetical protein [Pleurocapsa minor GSE-CHR-MK 17-07R]